GCAADLDLATAEGAVPTAGSSSEPVPADTARSSAACGQGARCTEPSCHQDQTSSVTNGRKGARSRSCTDKAPARVARADAAEAGPRPPYARSLTSST